MNAARLVVTEPAEPEPATFHLTGDELVVGRDPSVDLLVGEASVSGRHGRFAPGGAGWTYTDLGSTNGSVLVRAGIASVCDADAAVPLVPGDLLLLGDRARAVAIRVERLAEVVATPPSTQTVLARQPLADLLAPRPGASGPAALATLAARMLVVATPEALAAEALTALRALAPHAGAHGVALWGPGVAATAGEPIPKALVEAAADGLVDPTRAEVLGDDAALPTSQSLALQGARAALVVPLVVSGASWGLLYATSPVGAAALSGEPLTQAAIAGPLIALGAADLSRRLAAEARADALAAENQRLNAGREVEPIGKARVFVEVVRMARQVAATDVPLLVTGETGTGKEVLARFVHRASLRAGRPFVAFNCAAIPESLIESELFGAVKGAFTGANQDRKGLFEEAHQGTLFLDEIGEMPMLMQAKLLRVLQDGEVRRVGANKPGHVDVRVVSATHRDLAQLVAEGKFRADLMYRLNAVTLKLPPLRERGDDIALIAHVLLSRAAAQCRKSLPGFAPDALWALTSYAFPGNIRELDNEILRAAALTPDGQPVTAAVFSDALRKAGPPAGVMAASGVMPLKDAVLRAERQAIEAALSHAAGNVSEAARLLGVTRPGLYKAMERLDLR